MRIFSRKPQPIEDESRALSLSTQTASPGFIPMSGQSVDGPYMGEASITADISDAHR